ncbi:MAG: kelch repeat-containing protein, partial [Candidatus Eisenbacteria bacterium]
LSNGKLLVAGGYDGANALGGAELYDPDANTWSPAGGLLVARFFHTATLLSNGKVLVVGGHDGTGGLASAELYDPVANTWSPAAGLMAGWRPIPGVKASGR